MTSSIKKTNNYHARRNIEQTTSYYGTNADGLPPNNLRGRYRTFSVLKNLYHEQSIKVAFFQNIESSTTSRQGCVDIEISEDGAFHISISKSQVLRQISTLKNVPKDGLCSSYFNANENTTNVQPFRNDLNANKDITCHELFMNNLNTNND